MHAILLEYGLPYHFPEDVEAEAETISQDLDPKEIQRRRDMRDVTTFTIDPEDAKDFDDALSVRDLDSGHLEVGVHIADVTHYVRPGSRIEEEAVERATSVYLVDRTIPMLPEVLSNNLCSLRPNEDRYAFSAVFELDKDGQVVKEWFGRTVIHSDRRFTYAEAQERLESGKGDLAMRSSGSTGWPRRCGPGDSRRGASTSTPRRSGSASTTMESRSRCSSSGCSTPTG